MVQVKNAVAPFPVGIGKICGASGTADEEIFDAQAVEGGGILPDDGPLEKQGGSPGSVGGGQTGAGALLEPSARQRSDESDTRCSQIRLDGHDGGEAPAGFQVETGIAVIVSGVGDGRQGTARAGDGLQRCGAQKIGVFPDKPPGGQPQVIKHLRLGVGGDSDPPKTGLGGKKSEKEHLGAGLGLQRDRGDVDGRLGENVTDGGGGLEPGRGDAGRLTGGGLQGDLIRGEGAAPQLHGKSGLTLCHPKLGDILFLLRRVDAPVMMPGVPFVSGGDGDTHGKLPGDPVGVLVPL